MRKTLFILLACCLVATSAFAQITIKEELNEDKPTCEIPIDINGDEGRFFIKINGEPDDQGRTPVQIELENSSNIYEFLLFDHAWGKKELRKEQIFFKKGYIGKLTHAVENIDLNTYQDRNIPTGERYTFPDILVEEGKTYECIIPIHLAEPKPNWFCKKKKKLHSFIECTVQISVENRDEVYDELARKCDSLMEAFDQAVENEELCTHKWHRPSFDKQVEKYTVARDDLRTMINSNLYEKGWPKESRKYKRYKALLEPLDRMDYVLGKYKSEKHVCKGPHQPPGGNSCSYCNLSYQEIYNRLNRHYQNLYNGDVKKSAIINEVNALYRCATSHSGSNRGDSSYKAGINKLYNKIKNYKNE